MNDERSFGTRFAGLDSIDERLKLECDHKRRARFNDVDEILAKLISRALRGDRIVKAVPAKRRGDPETVELVTALSAEERNALNAHFAVAEQEKRGSWHMPEHEVLSLGAIHLVHWMGSNSRLVLSVADSDRTHPFLRTSPEAVAIWSFEPLFAELFLAFKLRGLHWLGNRTPEQQDATWGLIDPLYEALGIDPEPLDAFRPGTGWSTLTSAEVIQRREALARAWAGVADQAAQRYRIFRVGQLIERYYAKAKNGKALRRQVLTKAYGRTLTAYFGGDWLAFLAYIGEEVHGNEEIIQALPETKLMVGDSARVTAVANEFGLPADEVKKMLAAYWQTTDATSPVEQRVNVLKRFWNEFDELHAHQQSGMRSLWGLVQEYAYVHPRLSNEDPDQTKDEDEGLQEQPYAPRLYDELLSQQLKTDIERLWGTVVLPRWPERLVTEVAPYAQLAQAFGPALRFWEGAALTAWFLCEGPYSRTDIDGLPNYHHTQLEQMRAMGCPVGGELFRDLREAAEKYGAPTRGRSNTYTITISLLGAGEEEPDNEPHVSFEQLRDIVTKHRRAWAEQFLDRYLRTRWEAAMLSTADRYHRHIAQSGKTPTAKQFSKLAASDANLWSGGDLTGVCGVLGLKAPPAPTRSPRLVPLDPDEFATRLYARLRGSAYQAPPGWQENQDERAAWNNFTSLANMCVEYLQLQEALGDPPALKTFGRQKFSYRSSVLAEDPENAWDLYAEAVRDVRLGEGSSNCVTPDALGAVLEREPKHSDEPASVPISNESVDARAAEAMAPATSTSGADSRLGRSLGRLRRRR